VKSATTATRAHRVLKRAAIVTVALAAAILLAEVSLRTAMRVGGRAFDVADTRARVRELLGPIQRFVPANVGIAQADGARRPILHPYYGSEDEHDTGGVLWHFRADAQPGDFAVLLVGGSVAAALGGDERAAFESAFARMPALAGRRIVFLNGAHAAHKSPQMVNRVALLLSFGYRPDVVIALDGFNETALALDNASGQMNPLWPSAPVWGAVVAQAGAGSPERMEILLEIWDLHEESRRFVERTRAIGLHHTALGSRYTLSRLDSMSRRRNELQTALIALGETSSDPRSRRQAGGPDFDHDPASVLDVSVRGWAESSRSLRALCESRGIAYVHVLQPALFDAGSKTPTADEARIQNPSDAWLRGARAGYPLLRAKAEELVSGGEEFVDASRVFAGLSETVYLDPCHLNARGNQLLCEFIVSHLPADLASR
jgi:hypothetical protein